MTIGSATSGAGAGKMAFDQLDVTIPESDVVPTLLVKLASGAHFSDATLSYTVAGGTAQVKLDTVFIATLQAAAADHGALPATQLSLVFGKLAVIESPTGGTPVTGGWDQMRNVSWTP